MNFKDQAALTPKFAVNILEAIADGVFTLDRTGVISSWNPAMERISGYSAEEALGKHCRLMEFSECFGKACPNGLTECGIFKYGRIDARECFLRHKEGRDVPIMKSARLVKDEYNTVIGVVETVTDLTELKSTRQQLAEADRKLGERHRLDNILGKSEAMQKVFTAVEAAAASDATILIQGESGTGKELVAGAIHHNSVRSPQPLITVNCSALSESLLESELFGHVKGAFTGAVRDRRGRFEEADGGTVFLDEIAEISPFMQVKLLRVLQEREVERVGDSRKRKIDIRIMAATNRVLLEQVKKGEFREDLYYRLKVFPVQVPPLRYRKEDIPLLAHHFIEEQNRRTGKRIKGVSADTMRLLMEYQWPGNVRELEHAIEHAFVLCDLTGTIEAFDLPVEIRKAEYHKAGCPRFGDTRPPGEGSLPARSPAFSPLRELTRESLTELLQGCGWNKAETARQLGVSRTAVWKYMKKLDIPLKQPDDGVS
ncbi:MAG: sigma-54 interaction domain-containing protein [Desulfosudaceae bacterium]